MVHKFQWKFTLLVLLCCCDVRKYVEASPGTVFMSQGDTSFQFTIPEHLSDGSLSNSRDSPPLHPKFPEHFRFLPPNMRESSTLNKNTGIPILPHKHLKSSRECSAASAFFNCASPTKSTIKTRQVDHEFSPRLLPRPISPVGPNMLLPIPRLIFPRHVQSSVESDDFQNQIQRPRFPNTPIPERNFHDSRNEILPPKFLEHQTEFQPMKSAEVLNQIRQQSKFRGSRGPFTQSIVNQTPSFNRNNFTNQFIQERNSDRPSVTYAQYKNNHNAFNFKPHPSEEFRNFGPRTSVPIKQRQSSNQEKEHPNDLPLRVITPPKRQEDFRPDEPQYSVSLHRFLKFAPKRNSDPEAPRFNNEIPKHREPHRINQHNPTQNTSPRSAHRNTSFDDNSITPLNISEREDIFSTSQTRNIGRAEQELELYQKLLGFLLTKLSNSNNNFMRKTEFSQHVLSSDPDHHQ